MRAVVYYTVTTIIAVFIGIVMVLIIHPGKGSKDEFSKQQQIEQVSAADAFLDLIRYTFMHADQTNILTRSQQRTTIESAKMKIHSPLLTALLI